MNIVSATYLEIVLGKIHIHEREKKNEKAKCQPAILTLSHLHLGNLGKGFIGI